VLNAQRSMKIFLCHAHADRGSVHVLHNQLTKIGMDVWLDKERLLPGQDWELEIRNAVSEADIVIVCLSKQFSQAGFRQKEVRLALDTAMEKPEGEIFIIPARLEECDVPSSLRTRHWVDLFDERGYERLLQTLHEQAKKIHADSDFWETKPTSPAKTTSQTFSVKPHQTISKLGQPAKEKWYNHPALISISLIASLIGIMTFVTGRDKIIDFFSNEVPTAEATLSSTLTPTFPILPKYDFAENLCSAAWSNSTDSLICPGQEETSGGFVMTVDRPKSENGSAGNAVGILIALPSITDSQIQGVYSEYTIAEGDRFRATIGCESGFTLCRVGFRLDYQNSAGEIRNFWSFRERYDGWTYNTDLDLSRLAGQTVKFILVIDSDGSSTGDRALWISPRIENPDYPNPADCKDWAQFIVDVTVPDGTRFQPSERFTKTMRFKNIGTCAWTPGYRFIFDGGEKMNGHDSQTLDGYVLPGQFVDLSLELQAPERGGHYIGYWKFQNDSGESFGLGREANNSIWVEINVGYSVIGFTPTP
jgi:hypothetical protein